MGDTVCPSCDGTCSKDVLDDDGNWVTVRCDFCNGKGKY